MTPERMIELIESVSTKDGPRLVRAYTGRGMANRPGCVAFATSSPIADTALIVANVEDMEEASAIANVFKGARTDAFGRDTVVYFPRLADTTYKSTTVEDDQNHRDELERAEFARARS